MRCWAVMPRCSPPTFVLRPKTLDCVGDTTETVAWGSGGRGAAGPTVGRGRPSIGAPAFWGGTPFCGGTPGWGLPGCCCAATPVTMDSSTTTARKGPRPPRHRIMPLASANRRAFVNPPRIPTLSPSPAGGVRRRRSRDRARRLGSVARLGAMARRGLPPCGARRAVPARGPGRRRRTARRCARCPRS